MDPHLAAPHRIPTVHELLEFAVPTDLSSPTADALRASLLARQERILQRPILGSLPTATRRSRLDELREHIAQKRSGFVALFAQAADREVRPFTRVDPETKEHILPVAFDYDELWRGAEREVLEAVKGAVEERVSLLTDEQAQLLRTSPRALLDLQPPPASALLMGVNSERIGGRDVVVALRLMELPENTHGLRHVAILPNLIPLQRQLDALDILTAPDCPAVLQPLQALLGLRAMEARPAVDGRRASVVNGGLDEFQADCVRAALETPHYAVIEGPPGSGKTTVIRSILEREVAAGGRALVVSPTHVAVDNVVEKLWPGARSKTDTMAPHTLPTRWAARPSRLSDRARVAAKGGKYDIRAANIARRVAATLKASHPALRKLWGRLDENMPGHAPLSAAIAQVQPVLCGTPIGVLSSDLIREMGAGAFDLLVVDEVSKMTLGEFLAVAVKARRWVVVGDPAQLPPYNDAAEVGVALDDVIAPEVELATSVSAAIEAQAPAYKGALRLVVVAQDPPRACSLIRKQLQSLDEWRGPRVLLSTEQALAGMGPAIVVCAVDEVEAVVRRIAPAQGRDLSHHAAYRGAVQVLVERGLRVERPELSSGARLVEGRDRAPARLIDLCFELQHVWPWAQRAQIRPPSLGRRKGIAHFIPQAALLDDDPIAAQAAHEALLHTIAARFSVNSVSVYDWLAGLPGCTVPVGPLERLGSAMAGSDGLRAQVASWVRRLCNQYRMGSALSSLPRRLFYFDDAMRDGQGRPKTSALRTLQVDPSPGAGESNEAEVQQIVETLQLLAAGVAPEDGEEEVLVITPYRAQEQRLNEALATLRGQNLLDGLRVEVCTFDRCQGREAPHVLISLVRSRATAFLDNPKRWNVALTRAQRNLLLIGDIQAYQAEAIAARRKDAIPKMSLLAAILEAAHNT
jgi:hypothetical protein